MLFREERKIGVSDFKKDNLFILNFNIFILFLKYVQSLDVDQMEIRGIVHFKCRQ